MDNICSEDFFIALSTMADVVFELNMAFLLIGFMLGMIVPYLLDSVICHFKSNKANCA